MSSFETDAWQHHAEARPAWPMLVLVLSLLTGLGVMAAGERAYRDGSARVAALVTQVTDLGNQPPGAPTEGRLVRVAGPLSVTQPIVDRETGVTAHAVMLRREVEIWWTLDLPATASAPARTLANWATLRAEQAPLGWPAGLLGGEATNQTVRISDTPLDPALARTGNLGFPRPLPPADVRAALSALLPERVVEADGDWTVLAAESGARRAGDIRIRYRQVPDGGIATAIGGQRRGVLLPPGDPWRGPMSFNAATADMLPYGMVDQPGEWRLVGRISGGLVIVLGVMIAVLGRAVNDGALASAMQWEPIALLVMLPFALLAAPAIIGAAVLAWWMAQGWTQLAIGVSAALTAAAVTLWLAYRRADPAPAM